jgi:hypothetical protein
MKLRIEKVPTGLTITIDDMAGHERTLVERIRRCRETAWACPSGECEKIWKLEDRVEEGRLFLSLTPKPGEELSPARMEKCMGYMLHPYLKESK